MVAIGLPQFSQNRVLAGLSKPQVGQFMPFQSR